jgi:uncharacterized membrane protein (DUF4010 family)
MIRLDDNNLLGIGIASLGGAAVGIDRQRVYKEDEPGVVGGVRTFTLLGTIAGVCGFLIKAEYSVPAIVLLAGALSAILIVRFGADNISRDATTEVAAIAVLASGLTAGLGYPSTASALYAWIVLLLIQKSWLHALVNRIGIVELQATAQFAAMALIVLPLLPSRNLGPAGIINLRSIWILVLVFSGLSFAGYLTRKALGNEAGWVLTGLIGGLVSSTQVTLAFSRDSRKYPESQIPLFGGVMAASTVSMLRVCVLCIVLRPALAASALAYVAAPVLIGGLASLSTFRRRHTGNPETFTEKSPLRLTVAVYLSLIFVFSQYFVTLARLHFGSIGIFSSAGLLGSVDIDAVIASLLPLIRQGIQTDEAAKMLGIGITGNTTVKLLIAIIWGSSAFRKYAVLGFTGILLALIGGIVFMD